MILLWRIFARKPMLTVESMAKRTAKMAKCLNLTEWRACTLGEVKQFFDSSSRPDAPSRSTLVIKSKLKPFDMYCYLVARFGQPNGIQNFLRKDDSDNLIHWDFNIMAEDVHVYFVGASRSVHLTIGESMSREEWLELIASLKADFRKMGREKSAVLNSLEKFSVFQNKFVSIADLCAEFHERIPDVLSSASIVKTEKILDDLDSYKKSMQDLVEKSRQLFGNCLNLRLLTPVMAEAYINMVVLMFCPDTIRTDDAAYQNLLRMKIPDKIKKIGNICSGFVREIDTTTESYRHFLRVVNMRNFALHGNVDPVREQMETVYFDGRRPIFVRGGDNIETFFDNVERLCKPSEVIEDYEAVHIFLIEIADCLDGRTRAYFDQVITDAYPGFELKKLRVTRLFPDHVATARWGNLLYDDQI